MSFILFVLAVIGGTYILCRSEIMKEFRTTLNGGEDPLTSIPATFLGKLISCPRCTSFWISYPVAIFAFTGGWWVILPLVGVGILDIYSNLIELVEDYLKCLV